jgi:hypothetical protein
MDYVIIVLLLGLSTSVALSLSLQKKLFQTLRASYQDLYLKLGQPSAMWVMAGVDKRGLDFILHPNAYLKQEVHLFALCRKVQVFMAITLSFLLALITTFFFSIIA